MDKTMMDQGRMPNDQGDEQRLQMAKEQMKAMIDGMDANQLAVMGDMMGKMNEAQQTEPASVPAGNQDTNLDLNEPKTSGDAKLKAMGMM